MRHIQKLAATGFFLGCAAGTCFFIKLFSFGTAGAFSFLGVGRARTFGVILRGTAFFVGLHFTSPC